ncbi:hypothetical protein K5E_22150 [Enterococcus thailandicus]|nr:hypothetical protein K4E_00600 [Enterococcus thailandicus]GMC10076.1 hypothetical protein K5E_22150 [Enterococcus thailandicus]
MDKLMNTVEFMFNSMLFIISVGILMIPGYLVMLALVFKIKGKNRK